MLGFILCRLLLRLLLLIFLHLLLNYCLFVFRFFFWGNLNSISSWFCWVLRQRHILYTCIVRIWEIRICLQYTFMFQWWHWTSFNSFICFKTNDLSIVLNKSSDRGNRANTHFKLDEINITSHLYTVFNWSSSNVATQIQRNFTNNRLFLSIPQHNLYIHLFRLIFVSFFLIKTTNTLEGFPFELNLLHLLSIVGYFQLVRLSLIFLRASLTN